LDGTNDAVDDDDDDDDVATIVFIDIDFIVIIVVVVVGLLVTVDVFRDVVVAIHPDTPKQEPAPVLLPIVAAHIATRRKRIIGVGGSYFAFLCFDLIGDGPK
jgi:hypothetical protein